MKAIKFIKQVFLCVLVIALLVFLTNCYVLFGTSKFIANKERVGKIIKLKFSHPECAIMGTSRARYGYNPNHPYFPKNTFNTAAAAINVKELNLYIDFLINRCHTKSLFLAMDYMMFCGNQKVDSSFKEIIGNDQKTIQYLFSWDVFTKAFKRLKREPYLSNGYREAKKVTNLPLRKGYGYNRNRKLNTQSINTFKLLLEKCYENEIEVTFIFNPSSALCWEDMDHWGWFDDWLDWKKMMVDLNESAAKSLNKVPYPIYDFAVYNKFTTELIPPDSETYLKYHRDISHFNGNLGSLVLDVLHTGELKNIGVKLTSENINNHLISFRKERIFYQSKLMPFINKMNPNLNNK